MMRWLTLLVVLLLAPLSAHAQGVSPNQMFGCNQTAKYDASTSGTTRLVLGVSNKQTYVCGWNIMPGGTVNPDKLRVDDSAVKFVREFVYSGKPVAAICHGPWTLVEAGVVAGRTLTSYPSIRTDIRNGGGHVVDEEVVVWLISLSTDGSE